MTTESDRYHRINLFLDPIMCEKVKACAKERTDGNVSQLLRDLIERFLFADNEIVPILIKVPKNLRKDPVNLKKWLDIRMEAIYKTLLS